MKNLYFIDNESIKRTAKIIHKKNINFKYTEILEELAIIMGYDSYNHYENYLTNSLIKDNGLLKNLIVINNLNAMNVIWIKNEFKSKLETKGYQIDDLFFAKKIIDEQIEGLKKAPDLTILEYLHYSPLFYQNYNEIDGIQINKKNINILDSVYYIRNLFEKSKNEINDLINLIMKDDKESLEKLENYKNDLKSRSVYFYIKSKIDEYEYDESILLRMIFEFYSDEKIEYEINKIIDYSSEIRVFKNKSSKSTALKYYPLIRESITEQNPILLGKDNNDEKLFLDVNKLHSNINLIGFPGSGKTAFVQMLFFQLMMHNRGFCSIDFGKYNHSIKFVRHVGEIVNKEDDTFYFNEKSNIKKMSSMVANDKMVISNMASENLFKDKYNAMERFDVFIDNLKDQYYSKGFRTKKIPYYISVSERFDKFKKSTLENIQKLNKANIFFIFDNQVFDKDIDNICDTFIMPTSSAECLLKNISFEKYEILKHLINNKKLLGTSGLSSKGAYFLVMHNNSYENQFLVEFDKDIYKAIDL